MGPELLVWLAIAFCVTQSAMFSGLNLAFFSLSRLHLEVEAENGNRAARRILSLRKDSNFLLTTIEHHPVPHGDDVVDNDLILVWTDEGRRIITGADILGRLLRGISRRSDWRFAAVAPSEERKSPAEAAEGSSGGGQ